MLKSLVMCSLAFALAHAKAADDTQIRVRVRRHLGAVDISGLGLKVTAGSTFFEVNPEPGLAKAKITRLKNGEWRLRWNLKRDQKIHAERLWIRGEMIRVGLDPVPYDLELIPNGEWSIDVVAWMKLEDYLAGVLPSEMPVSWPEEALKAQAVAARSFVLKMAADRKSHDFDVDSTVFDQVFKFMQDVQSHRELKKKLARVLRETRGEVLTDHRGKVMKAFYSADCGCQTEDPRFVWGSVPSFQSVRDPTCARRKTRQWQVSLNREVVRTLLLQAMALPGDSELRALHVGARTPSGRVAEVAASFDVHGRTVGRTISSQDFRRIFGFGKIRSTNFKLQWLAKELKIHGQGIGHGVGLCQTGAKQLAEEGTPYRDILHFYYPQGRLQASAQ